MGNKQEELTLIESLINYIDYLNEKYIQDIDEYYYDLLEQALEYGMTPYQFWEEDIEQFYCYRNAYLKRTHTLCHIQGLYYQIALSTTLSNILKKKGEKSAEYPKNNLFDQGLEAPLIKVKDDRNEMIKRKITKNISRENLEEQYRLRLANCY